MLNDPSLKVEEVLEMLASPKESNTRKAKEIKVLMVTEFVSGLIIFLADLYAHKNSGSDD